MLFMGASAASALRVGESPVSKLFAGGQLVWPRSQSFLGAHIDWDVETPADFTAKLGYVPRTVGEFSEFPIEDWRLDYLNPRIDLVAEQGASLMLSLMPNGGLTSLPADRTKLTTWLTNWNNLGVPVTVRYGHEMNGSWYPWGQKPAAFIAEFRLIADAVRASPNSTILWCPNEASGYPYNGGAHSPAPGSADFIALDTNVDEALSAADDPYAPFWPGAAYVDAVGLSLYHYGTWWPWDTNDIPEAGTVAGMIDGTYHGATLPDFYTTYAAGYSKPFVIAETATFFNVDTVGGPTELAIKQEWWNQVFEVAFVLPLLDLVMWFEYQKTEGGLGPGGGDNGTVDWRLLASPAVRDAFVADFDAFLNG